MKQSFRNKLVIWIYQGNPKLIEGTSRKSQDFFLLQTIFGSTIMLLLGGQFLTGFAIYLGASDELVGYIPILSSISGSFVIFAGLFLERFTYRKKLVVILNSILKPLLTSVVLIPLFIPKSMQVTVLFVVLVIAYALNAIMNIAINSWFVNVIPLNIRGQYYSTRQIIAVGISAIIPIIAGRIVDTAATPYIGFIILYGWAFLFIWGENYAFLNIEDAKIDNMGKGNLRIRDVFCVPMKHKEFIIYTLELVIFYFVLYLSASITQAYMLKYLELSYTFIGTMRVISSLVQIVAYSFWGRIGDKRGHKWVMSISFWFYIVQMGLWTCVSRNTMYFIIPIIHLISAIGGSGFAVSVFNTKYEIIPSKGCTVYDGFYSATIGLTLMLAPWVGGQIRLKLSNLQYVHQYMEFGELRILFALSAVGILLLQLFNIISHNLKMNAAKYRFRIRKQ